MGFCLTPRHAHHDYRRDPYLYVPNIMSIGTLVNCNFGTLDSPLGRKPFLLQEKNNLANADFCQLGQDMFFL